MLTFVGVEPVDGGDAVAGVGEVDAAPAGGDAGAFGEVVGDGGVGEEHAAGVLFSRRATR